MEPVAFPPPPRPPDTITITEAHHGDVRSQGADVAIRICRIGVARWHAGALEAARRRFQEAGIPAEAIDTTSFARESIGGWLVALAVPIAVGIYFLLHELAIAAGLFVVVLLAQLVGGLRWLARSEFRLGVRCPDAVVVGRVLDVAAARSGLDVDSVSWRYDVDPSGREARVEECIRRANARAAVVARGLGVEIRGVHSYVEHHEDPQRTYPAPSAPVAVPSRARFALAPAAHGPMSSTERTGVVVTIQYLVGDYRPSPPAASDQPSVP